MMKVWKNLFKGLIRENPVLVLLLGTCPTLAVTTGVQNALGMGVAAMALFSVAIFFSSPSRFLGKPQSEKV